MFIGVARGSTSRLPRRGIHSMKYMFQYCQFAWNENLTDTESDGGGRGGELTESLEWNLSGTFAKLWLVRLVSLTVTSKHVGRPVYDVKRLGFESDFPIFFFHMHFTHLISTRMEWQLGRYLKSEWAKMHYRFSSEIGRLRVPFSWSVPVAMHSLKWVDFHFRHISVYHLMK